MKPKLTKELEHQIFLNYYYLKEELIAFCKAEQLQSTGSKEELTSRIAQYLKTGEKITKKKVTKKDDDSHITLDTIITLPITYSENKRAFFEEHLGPTFHFYVPFQRWLKNNPGKTYQEAIEAYKQIVAEKKEKKTTIDKQFEYNTYIRDFFNDNKGKSLKEAIACWKYKKSLPGHNKYEESDLQVLYDSTDSC